MERALPCFPNFGPCRHPKAAAGCVVPMLLQYKLQRQQQQQRHCIHYIGPRFRGKVPTQSLHNSQTAIPLFSSSVSDFEQSSEVTSQLLLYTFVPLDPKHTDPSISSSREAHRINDMSLLDDDAARSEDSQSWHVYSVHFAIKRLPTVPTYLISKYLLEYFLPPFLPQDTVQNESP